MITQQVTSSRLSISKYLMICYALRIISIIVWTVEDSTFVPVIFCKYVLYNY